MASERYYQVMGEAIGPLSMAEMRWKAEAGEITADTWVRNGREGEWITAFTVEVLFPEAAVTAEIRPPAIAASPPAIPASPPKKKTKKRRQQKERRNALMVLAILFATAVLLVLIKNISFDDKTSSVDNTRLKLREYQKGRVETEAFMLALEDVGNRDGVTGSVEAQYEAMLRQLEQKCDEADDRGA